MDVRSILAGKSQGLVTMCDVSDVWRAEIEREIERLQRFRDN